jgi:tRNA-splicing ligase RtcB
MNRFPSLVSDYEDFSECSRFHEPAPTDCVLLEALMDKRFRYRQKNVRDLVAEDGLVRVWDTSGDLDRQGILQAFLPLLRTCFVSPYIALMPDHHPGPRQSGIGTMVGSVIPTQEVLLLAAIGGDIGCGVTAVKLPVQANDLKKVLPQLRDDLRATIPIGAAHNASVSRRVEENPLWQQDLQCGLLTNRLKRILIRQFASLGGGNHFLELQEEADGSTWLMLHSGSRTLGVRIKDYYIEAGSTQAGIDRKAYRRIPHLPAACDLALAYMNDLGFALAFARESRKEMMRRAIEVVALHSRSLQEAGTEMVAERILDVAHNYVAQENHLGETYYVHRKGAIRAFDGESVMIPGSMGTTSFIAEGRGNDFAFCSCSHGAGRVMSRHAASRSISDKCFAESMEGVEHEGDSRLKDESPLAYKDIHTVMRGQNDLIRIQIELSPIMSIKGVN